MNRSKAADGLQAGPTASRPTYLLVQVLRAVAALMVVLHHEVEGIWQRFHVATLGSDWVNGRAGVDIFFVISGFVMAISSRPLEGTEHPARTFLARRLERVVPLYWLLTTIKLVLTHFDPSGAVNGARSLSNVACSYLFVPWIHDRTAVDPVLVVGWTLNFEMMFYILFGIALAARVRPWKVLTPAFAVCIALSAAWRAAPVALHWYGQSLLLEFLFGIALAHCVHRVRRVPPAVASCVAAGALGMLLLWAEPNFSRWRGLGWGIPALLLVGSCVALERSAGERAPRWLLELGDASYSIYLVHGFVIPVFLLLFAHSHIGSPAAKLALLLVLLLLSALSGDLLYRLLERPMMHWFKGRRRTAVPANA